jgi:hypothetical protein
VFRAEWSQEIFGSKDAGHPHWHVDLFPLVRDISSIHLAMAGWESEGLGNGIACWQSFVENDLRRLETWCERVLHYSVSQLYNFF